jgi:hypothetical protein
MRIGAKLYHIRFGMWRNGSGSGDAPLHESQSLAEPSRIGIVLI